MSLNFGSVATATPSERTVLLIGLAFVTLTVGVFVVDAEGSTEPVPFDQTVETGLSAETEQVLLQADATIPKAQVFHSQYQFVVGYRGVGYMIDELQQPGTTQQFGRPVAIYVSDFSNTEPSLTEAGYPQTETDPGWVRAHEAAYVVGSDARTPAGDAVLPFGSVRDATDFARAHGGTVLDWSEIRTREIDLDTVSQVRERVDQQRAAADERVAATRPLADREVAVVVGEDAPTIQAAIDAAPTDTAIRVPPGTYNETLQVDRSVTIRGPGATVRGDGNGSVVTVTGDSVAITGLSIAGVGDSTEPDEGEVDGEQWDAFVEAGYGYSDAAIEAENVSALSVSDVAIDTPTSGVVLRDVVNTVVENVTIRGADRHREGFMGVLSISSPVVVQNSTLLDGRDGIYLHRADGSVIRHNRFVSNRYGVHLMYTSETLIADNVARRVAFAGVTIMTDPTGNAVVGNDVRNSTTGLSLSGANSYVAGNILAGNDRGVLAGTEQSLYERNVVYGNEIGVRTGTIRPSNRIVRNDFVDNDNTVEVGAGPLRIWNYDGEGNYWSKRPTGLAEDAYSPTSGLDTKLREPGTGTLAASPAATALDAVRNTVAGSRESEVLDTNPRSTPVRPETIDELDSTDDQ